MVLPCGFGGKYLNLKEETDGRTFSRFSQELDELNSKTFCCGLFFLLFH